MIALDTNILVYAHRRDSHWFSEASGCLRQLAEAPALWAIPWPCVHEFLAIVTNPRIYRPPTRMADALRQVEFWMESPSLRLIGESDRHLEELASILLRSAVSGGAVHDARVASICLEHGVTELWTVDRDSSRFAGPRVRNPLVR